MARKNKLCPNCKKRGLRKDSHDPLAFRCHECRHRLRLDPKTKKLIDYTKRFKDTRLDDWESIG